MISFSLTEEQLAIHSMLENFSREKLTPVARDFDENGEIPFSHLQAGWELGLIANAIPETFGGGGERSALTNVVSLEQLGYGCASIATAMFAPACFAFALTDAGSTDQQQTYLPPFIGDDFYPASVALHESSMSFSVEASQTRATPKGDHWILNGCKRMVVLGSSAKVFLVIARAEDDKLAAFIVGAQKDGLNIEAESGQMGLKPVPMAKLTFNNVEVSKSQRLGGEEGCDIQRAINSMRLGSAAMALGVARAATEYAIPYAKERVAFGEAIGKKQSIAFMLADMHSHCEALRWLIWKAASQLDQQVDATRNTVLAQNYAQRYAVKTVDDALQVFGGHGFIRDFPLEMWLRNVRTLTLHDAAVAA